MVKECRVVLRNPINMVVLFDGVEVQMPTDNGSKSVVYIKYDNGNYIICEESVYDEYLNKSKRQREPKKNEIIEEIL